MSTDNISGPCLCDLEREFNSEYSIQHAGLGSSAPYFGLPTGHQGDEQQEFQVSSSLVDGDWFVDSGVSSSEGELQEQVLVDCENTDSLTGSAEWITGVFDFPQFDSPTTPDNVPDLDSQSSRATSPASDLSSSQPPSPSFRRSARNVPRINDNGALNPATESPKKSTPRTPQTSLSNPSHIRRDREKCACQYEGCKKQFTRWDDRDRHEKGCHGKARERFYCVHCDASGEPRGFCRKDKVKSHWNNIHKREGLEFDFRKVEINTYEPWVVSIE